MKPPSSPSAASASVLLNRLLTRGKFRHVQVLLRLAELGSVQRAADAVGISQSAVTQSLASLEELLETRLFDRHSRGVRPTEACSHLLPVARRLMSGMAQGAESIAALNQRGKGLVRVTASPSAITGLLSPAITTFFEQHPVIDVALKEATGEELMLDATNGEADLVVCREVAVTPEGASFQALLADDLVVVAAQDHPLAQAPELTWDGLTDQAWVLPPAGSLARTRFDELAQRLDFNARVYPLITRTPSTLWWVLRQRPVLGFVPRSAVRHLVETGEIVVLPVQARIAIEPIGVLVSNGQITHPALLLLTHLRQQATAPA